MRKWPKKSQAGIAQLVEHLTRNEGVVSSSLISGFFHVLFSGGKVFSGKNHLSSIRERKCDSFRKPTVYQNLFEILQYLGGPFSDKMAQGIPDAYRSVGQSIFLLYTHNKK